jgi:4-hydroxybenzoyl-CoA thioesterase
MFVNRRVVRIEFGHCDPAGIVWYPRYFEFFDGATAGLFEAAGFPKQALLKRFDVAGFPMVDTRARFMIPSRFGDDIIIESRVTQFRRSSFDIEHKVFRSNAFGEETLALEGSETRVLVKKAEDGGIRSTPVPDEVVAALSQAA